MEPLNKTIEKNIEHEINSHIEKAFETGNLDYSEAKEIKEEERLLKEDLLKVIEQESSTSVHDNEKIELQEWQKILNGEEIEKIKKLFVIAYEKDLYYATEVCKSLDDPFLLDLFHDILVRDGFYKKFIKKNKEKESDSKLFDYVLFLVKMPRFDNKNKTGKAYDPKNEIAKFEEILTNFFNFKEDNFFKKLFYGDYAISLEIASKMGEEETHFFVSVPRKFASNAQKYIQGAYPAAQMIEIPEDYIIFEPKGYIRGGHFILQKTEFLPINTYQNLAQDPLSVIANVFSQIKIHDGLSLQLIIKPGANDFKQKGRVIIDNLKKGNNLNEATRSVGFDALSLIREGFSDFIFGKKTTSKDEQKQAEKKMLVDENILKAIESKINKQVFEINIRIISSSENQEEAERLFSDLAGAFGQFSLINFNEFKLQKLSDERLKRLVYDYSFRRFNKRERIILNTEEITSIYHFPLSHIESPQILWKKAGEAPPPTDLPKSGENLIGKIIFRQQELPVYFSSKDDRRRHFYIVGQTGTGKTSLLREMIRQDILKGHGVAVIDPHGDLIESTLANIPKERIDNIILFEPFDLDNPMGLNMLEWEYPEQKDFAVQEMIAIFHKLFPPEIIGPMFEHYMRNAMLALMADKSNPGTLVEIPRIFTDDEFMEARLKHVSDHVVRSFWEKEWKKITGSTKSDMLGYVVSKVGRFVENEMMRNIVGQGKSSFNFEEIINNNKIFLANLSKGLTGEINSSLLGLIIVSKLQMSAMKRGRINESDRKDFYLYLDEFQNFTTDSIATILSEARKYRLNLILAHQFIPQLSEPIKNAVMGNVGSICSFRVGVEDAELLEKQFEPEFSRYDLVNLDNFNAIAKMMINNSVSRPFRFVIEKPCEGNLEIIGQLKKLAKLKSAKKKELVEKEILERSKLFLKRG